MEGPRRTKLSSALSSNRHQHCSAGTATSVFSSSAGDGHTSQNTMLVLQLLDLSLFKPHVIIEEDFAHLSLRLPHLSLLLPTLNCSIRICIISGSLHLAASKLRAKGEGLPPLCTHPPSLTSPSTHNLFFLLLVFTILLFINFSVMRVLELREDKQVPSLQS